MQAGLGVSGFGIGNMIFMEARDCGGEELLETEGGPLLGDSCTLISFIFSALLCVPHSGRLIEIGI